MVDVKDKDLLSTLQDRLFMKRIRELGTPVGAIVGRGGR